MHLFRGHAFFRKALSQIFEQFRVGGTLTGETEIAGRIDNARAEVTLPHAIDIDAHGQGLPHNGFGQFQPATAMLERLRAAIHQNGEKMTLLHIA